MPTPILVSAGYDHTIRLWEPRSGYCYKTLQFTDSQVNKLEITPNRKYLAAAGNPHIKLFELASNNAQAVSTFSGHKSNVVAIGFEKQGDFLYSGSEDGTIKIWDPRMPNPQREFEYTEACNTVDLHPNQRELISGYQNGIVRVWDVKQGKMIHEFMPDDETGIRSVSVSRDGTYCSIASNNGKVYVYKMRQGEAHHFEHITTIDAHSKYILKCVFSPDTTSLATCSADNTLKIWDTANKFQLHRTLKGHQRWVWDCAYSSTSSFIVSVSSDHVARLWDIKTGDTIRNYTGHHKAISCVALNDEEYGSEPAQGSSSMKPGLISTHHN